MWPVCVPDSVYVSEDVSLPAQQHIWWSKEHILSRPGRSNTEEDRILMDTLCYNSSFQQVNSTGSSIVVYCTSSDNLHIVGLTRTDNLQVFSAMAMKCFHITLSLHQPPDPLLAQQVVTLVPSLNTILIRRILLSEPCTIIFRMCSASSGLLYCFTMCFKCFSVLFFSVRLISSVVLHVRLTCVY